MLGSSLPRKTLTRDFLSSVVVFLVAVPLCLGIALASGLPPTAGLISGIIGGLIVGYFSGCPLQVSGPAAGLITIVWETIHQHGIESFGLIVLMAGIIQISFGLLRLGKWFRAVSPAVIQGMLAGIGVLIFASQLHVMIDDKPTSSAIQNLLSIPTAIEKSLFPGDGLSHHLAAIIGVLTITTILFWNLAPKKLKLIPAPLVGVLVAVAVSYMLQLPIAYIEVPNNLLNDLHFLSFKDITSNLHLGLVSSALAIAFVASAETLLTATAVDRMRSGNRTSYNREVIAQGIGNSVAGFLGVLPITGVIVRSAANVQAGAETRMSTIFHGVWLLLFITILPFVLEMIPISGLAAILVYTGYRLVNIQEAKKLLRFGKSELFIYVATIVAIISTNLLEGIIIGFSLSLIKLLYSLARLDINI